MNDDRASHIYQWTRSAFIWSHVLGVPFWGLANLLSIILYKDMHISGLQITAILALKPMSALLAPYWSQVIYQRPDRMVSNLVWSHLLRYLPFLFIPWIQSPWVMIFAFGFYMMLYRGAIPAWMEIFKRNVPALTRERVVAYGSTIDFCGAAISPFLLGFFLDHYEHAWQWLFPPMALLGLASTWFVWKIPKPMMPQEGVSIPVPGPARFGAICWNYLVKPWKHSWHLLRERSDFTRFQVGFMLGGAGLMIYQPALPYFFVDTLDLSYTKMLLAVTLCKGIGFAAAAPFWTRLFGQWDIFRFTGLVTALAAAFPIVLLGAKSEIAFLYGAYALYGIMQAGSELSWHMSGPAFALEKESSVYSATNVFTVGLRGCVAPLLGSLLYAATNASVVMLVGCILCLLATRYLAAYQVPGTIGTSGYTQTT